MKHKPANHSFRVSTDAVRQAYRHERAAAISDVLEGRRAAAARIASNAAVTMTRDEGWAVLENGHGPDASDVIAEALKTLAVVDLDQKKEKANKPFMVKLAEMDDFTLSSPLIRFALRMDVIASAAAYLGMIPILQYANVVYSSHADAEPAKSQLYHCDSDEVEQIKVFVLCEEVTPAKGPLTFIPAALSQLVRERVEYKYKTRLTDDEVREALGPQCTEVALTGEAGTIAFIDTSRCLHYGSRFTDSSAHRLVVMLQYVTPLAFILPEDFRQGARFRHLWRPDQDDITAMVLGG